MASEYVRSNEVHETLVGKVSGPASSRLAVVFSNIFSLLVSPIVLRASSMSSELVSRLKFDRLVFA